MAWVNLQADIEDFFADNTYLELVNRGKVAWGLRIFRPESKATTLERIRRWRKLNRKAYLANRKAWREKNKERLQVQYQAQYERRREEICELRRIWREKNKDRINARRRESRASKRALKQPSSQKDQTISASRVKSNERSRAYRARNKDRINAKKRELYNLNKKKKQ